MGQETEDPHPVYVPVNPPQMTKSYLLWRCSLSHDPNYCAGLEQDSEVLAFQKDLNEDVESISLAVTPVTLKSILSI